MSLKKHNSHYRYSQVLTVDTNAYTANDVVGGLLTIPTGGGGILRKAKITDADAENAALDLYLFHTVPSVTAIADDAAFTVTAPNALYMLEERIRFEAANYVTVSSADSYCFGTVSSSKNLAVDCHPADGANLYAYLVCTGTPAYTAATDLRLELLFWVNKG